jgi:molybdenum cofactor cytidylyltransferase
VSGTAAAIVLAAGLGTRFGGGKMLAEIDGRPMLQHTLDTARAAGLDPIAVVVGHDEDAVQAAITWRGELVVRNPAPELGVAGSVFLGLTALESTTADRAIVLLGDQPFVTREQIGAVLTTEAPIVVASYAGVPGNPVALARSVWPLAARLGGDRGMSQLFAANPGLVRYVDVPGTNPDIDTPSDLARSSRD